MPGSGFGLGILIYGVIIFAFLGWLLYFVIKKVNQSLKNDQSSGSAKVWSTVFIVFNALSILMIFFSTMLPRAKRWSLFPMGVALVSSVVSFGYDGKLQNNCTKVVIGLVISFILFFESLVVYLSF